MSLVDDARRIAEYEADHHTDAHGCQPQCAWRSLPRIVAALEAAELVTIAYEEERILFGRPPGSQLSAALEHLDEALDGAEVPA